MTKRIAPLPKGTSIHSSYACYNLEDLQKALVDLIEDCRLAAERKVATSEIYLQTKDSDGVIVSLDSYRNAIGYSFSVTITSAA